MFFLKYGINGIDSCCCNLLLRINWNSIVSMHAHCYFITSWMCVHCFLLHVGSMCIVVSYRLDASLYPFTPDSMHNPYTGSYA